MTNPSEPTSGSSVPEAARAAVLTDVLLTVCGLCLDGAGGECHSPGCAFFICPAVDDEQAVRLRDGIERAAAVAEERATTGEVLARIEAAQAFCVVPADHLDERDLRKRYAGVRAALASPGECRTCHHTEHAKAYCQAVVAPNTYCYCDGVNFTPVASPGEES